MQKLGYVVMGSWLSPAEIWLLVGGLMIAIEAFAFPGVGFLFAGLGAIITAFALYTEITTFTSLFGQMAFFCGGTAFFALVLWKPMQRYIHSKGKDSGYKNIVGDYATVVEKITDHSGKVRWSGTIMNAKISEKSELNEISEDETVIIEELIGNSLIVAPYHHNKEDNKTTNIIEN